MAQDSTIADNQRGALPGDPTEYRIRTIIALRLCLLSIALLSASISTTLSRERGDVVHAEIYYFVALFFSICAASALWVKVRGHSIAFAVLQLFVDAVLITGIIYYTGGIISPFLFLYIPLIMFASVVFSLKIAVWVALVSIGSYALLAAGLNLRVISPAYGVSQSMPPLGILQQIVGLLFASLLAVAFTLYLHRRAHISEAIARESHETIQELSQRERMLIEEFPDAVIVTDMDFNIRALNAEGQKLFGVTETNALGKPIQSVVSLRSGVLKLASIGDPFFGLKREVEIPEGVDSLRLKYFERVLKTDEGKESGIVFIFQDVTRLRSVEEQLEMQERMAYLLIEDQTPPSQLLVGFVGESKIMQKVATLIERVAPTDATVLITGESGTGKEVVARAIHALSPRASKPFIAVNCGAISENLLESELFGHKKGAFTGALVDHQGLVRKAEGGTLFLDEIGELPLHLQVKLLRVLQERTIRPVGSDSDIPVNVRVVTATNRNLRREIELGRFREDLYYRLNVINITLPPLRERGEDVPLLIKSFMRRGRPDGNIPVIHPTAMQILLDYSYPGNVRELENIIERALVLGGDAILPEHLPDSMRERDGRTRTPMKTTVVELEGVSFPMELDKVLGELEKHYLMLALQRSNGAKKQAAQLLGINFRSFRYRLQKFGLGEEIEG